MAKKQARRASSAPSKADRGGFGFPAGATVTILEAAYIRAEDMGENALKGGRQADDPVLMLKGEVDGVDDPIIEHMGCGKAERLVASDDGAYLEIPDGSTANGLSEQCNAYHFLESISDKKKHGKKTVDESVYEEDIHALAGLQFVVGKKPIVREFQDDDRDRKPARPVTVAEEIISGPTGPGKASKKPKRASDEEEAEEKPRRKRPAAADEEEEAPAPKRGKKPAPVEDAEAEEGDVEEELEKVIVDLLASPKHRKGIDPDDAFNLVFTATKTHAQKKDIMAFAEEEAAFGKWLKNRNRPWSIDDDGLMQAVE